MHFDVNRVQSCIRNLWYIRSACKIDRNLLLSMKLTIVFIIAACLHAGAAVHSQQITLRARNEPFKSVIERIGTQSGYAVFANAEDISGAGTVTLELNRASLKEALDACFNGQLLSWELIDQAIVIRRRKTPAPATPLRPVSWVLHGTVLNEKEEPMAGVSVSIKETSRGASTDIKGTFMIEVASESDSLVITSVGYITQTVAAGAGREITIRMVPDLESQNMNEVVAVAYGTQRKREVVGSMTTIKPSELKVPSSNLTTALAGRLSGVIAYQRSGEPGNDNADFFVRGVTSFGTGAKNPLILIDGVELTVTDLARMSPDDIESFSVMKDATATALYGARGANGVILVTTKQGKTGKAAINLRMENSWSKATREIELADPVTYMRMYNDALISRNPTSDPYFTQEKIDGTAEGLHPVVYPAVDWRNMLLKPYTTNQRANMSVSGGGPVARYFVAGSYARDNGIFNVERRNNFNSNIKLNMYTLRSNVNINLSRSTEMVVRLSGSFDDYRGPIDDGTASGGAAAYKRIMRANPVLFPAYYPQDSAHWYVQHIMFGYPKAVPNGLTTVNPYAELVKGYKDYNRSRLAAQLELKQRLDFITKGLNFRTLFNTNRYSYFDAVRAYTPFLYYIDNYNPQDYRYDLRLFNPNSGTEYLSYAEPNKLLNSSFYWESALNYARTFNTKHSLSGMLVYVMRQSLDANTGSLQLSLPSRNIGLSGRMTYAYDSRYAAEFNFGYNGSERFYKDKRMGFFPSAGVAWTASDEKFLQPLSKTINLLKFRATYGLVGNDAIGSAADRFFYLSEVNMDDPGRGVIFGTDFGYRGNGITVNRYSNTNITWETSYKTNLAMELGLFNDFKVVAEYYTEKRTNILMQRVDIPKTMGLTAALFTNTGEGKGRGVDVSVEYVHNFKNDLWLNLRGNYTYAIAKITKAPDPDYGDAWWRYRTGRPLSQQWGFIAERLFIDSSDAVNSPVQAFGTPVIGGDIKYRDINNDGVIDDYDKVPIGFPATPEIVYGFGFSIGYRNIDFSSFFQGVANESFWISPANVQPFYNGNTVIKAFADDYYSLKHPDIYALYPRLAVGYSNNNNQLSTWWLRSGAFLRWKQAELGYTLSDRLAKRMHLSKLRAYVNGTNLLLWSDFKLWDVEMGGEGLGYPVQRVFNIGVQVNF